eukprot:scaffold2974_cov193-Pinguiococcus_pyrenoidosus.AAC.1
MPSAVSAVTLLHLAATVVGTVIIPKTLVFRVFGFPVRWIERTKSRATAFVSNRRLGVHRARPIKAPEVAGSSPVAIDNRLHPSVELGEVSSSARTPRSTCTCGAAVSELPDVFAVSMLWRADMIRLSLRQARFAGRVQRSGLRMSHSKVRAPESALSTPPSTERGAREWRWIVCDSRGRETAGAWGAR